MPPGLVAPGLLAMGLHLVDAEADCTCIVRNGANEPVESQVLLPWSLRSMCSPFLAIVKEL